MTNDEFQNHLWELRGTCAINQRYHQLLAWWWKAADRFAKISVAAVAVAALVTALLGESWKECEVVLALVAAVLAIVLNVLPFGEYEKTYDEFFRSWSDIRIDAEVLRLKVCSDVVEDHWIERLTELRAKEHALDAKEPAPVRWILRRCQEDEREATWGRGIRTAEQVECERNRREAAWAITSSEAAGAASR